MLGPRSGYVPASAELAILRQQSSLVELERELVELHRKQAALVFTSGYFSNVTGISTRARLLPNCLIL
jgi:5-aminolevulinate synthase